VGQAAESRKPGFEEGKATVSKPKLNIIVLHQNLGDENAHYARCPSPPLSGILLAGQTPDTVDVDVLHEMVRPIDYDSDADFVALSFMDYCAPHAYDVAARFRALGKTVIAGGRYPSTFTREVLPHFDTVVAGESERVWPGVVKDLLAGKAEHLYTAPFAEALVDIPPPRYDLVESAFACPVVTEASRGCPFGCSYCALNIRTRPYRTRPIEDVIRDLTATAGLPFHKRKMAMIYDNNFGGDMRYAKELLREIAKLDLWALGLQFTANCLYDDTFVDLIEQANCTMAFLGLESMNQPSLQAVNKRHNRVSEYREQFIKLKERGILSFTGMMIALDEDTPEYYQEVPDRLEEVDPSAIFLSISIPIPGTPFARQLEESGRILDRDLSHYDGDHLVFEPKTVSRDDVLEAFRRIMSTFYSWPSIARRWRRLVVTFLRARRSRSGAFRVLIMTFIYLKLSVFQRDRARRKIEHCTASDASHRQRRHLPVMERSA
jgi:radical SAM superfamily enzyme YgiQ (UPF0313 family)